MTAQVAAATEEGGLALRLGVSLGFYGVAWRRFKRHRLAIVAGAVLATLFAPKSVQEVRQDLNERVRAFGDRMGWSDRRAEDGDTAAH